MTPPRREENVSLGAFKEWSRHWDAFVAMMGLTAMQQSAFLIEAIGRTMASWVLSGYPATMAGPELKAAIRHQVVIAGTSTVCHMEANALCQWHSELALQFVSRHGIF